MSVSEAIKQALLAKEGAPAGTPVKEIADWRRKLQDIGNEGRAQSPVFWLKKALDSAPPDHDLVLDALRNPKELDVFRDLRTNAVVMAVVASKDTRWQRVQDDYDRNFGLFDRDDRRDSDEGSVHGQHVERCVSEADYVLVNEDNFGSATARDAKLRDRLEPDIALIKKPFTRHPSADESQMATAYTYSHNSRCLKRHVGAIIVDEHGRGISMGFNENPVGMAPCETEYGYCFKDENMEAKLELKRNVFCPSCGTKHDRLSKPFVCTNPDCRDSFKSNLFPSRNIELCTAIHVEEQAINNLKGQSAAGATMYVSTFPCLQCSRRIIEAKIARVVYVEAYPIKEAQLFLTDHKVVIEPFQGFKARYFNQVFKQVR